MSITGIKSNVNANVQVQAQPNKKTKFVEPLVGAGVGAVAGAGATALAIKGITNLRINFYLKYIESLKQQFLDLKTPNSGIGKSFKSEIRYAEIKTECLNQSLKQKNMLKSVAKHPLTFFTALAGFAIGCVVHHKKSKAEHPKMIV